MDSFYNYLSTLATLALGGAGTLLLAILTPFGNQLVSRKLFRKPAFSINPARLSHDFKATITSLNKTANKNQNLHAQIGDVYFDNFAKLISRDKWRSKWAADFTSPHIRAIFMQNEKVNIRLFFDADAPSESLEVQRPVEASNSPTRSIFQVDNTQELLNFLKSDCKIYTLFSTGTVSKNFPHRNDNTYWNAVLDGKELVVDGINNLEISGYETEILQSARYAWVVIFRNCTTITLHGLIFGHTYEGYCLGGVLKFESCSNIHIKNCDLFGCGTYGLEFNNCFDIEISDTIVRDCSYGIANISNTYNIVISDCTFRNNCEFDLINVDDKTHSFTTQRCLFEDNQSDGYIFNFLGKETAFLGIFIWDCVFRNNACASIVNNDRYISMHTNEIIDSPIRDKQD